jgi:arylsulfatase A-like enzyme
MGRPNLVFFMPDQLRADAVGAFGNPVASTPNIDALADDGVKFEQAFGQHSVCTQSRISMFTGWYPHTAGHRSLTHLLQPHEPNVFRSLLEGGYHVALAGARGDMMGEGVTRLSASRWGFTKPPDLAAVANWHRRRYDDDHRLGCSFLGGRLDGEPYDLDAATVATAVDWLAEGLPEPWCLLIPLIYPHPPFAVEDPWYSLHDRADVPLPSPAVDGKPGFHAEIHRRYGLDALTADDWREIVAIYYGMTSRVDAQLGRVLQAVDATGQRDRTVTFFFTDHGEYLGDFGLVEKWPSGLEPCLVQNPLIVHDPSAGSGPSPSLVEMVDLTATLLDYAELDPGYTQFGRSLRALLADPALAHREAVFSEGGFLASEGALLEPDAGGHYRHKRDIQRDLPELAGKAVAVRTHDWAYVERLYEDPELYDRRSDPAERHNLASTGDHADVIADHHVLLHRWLLETSDVFPWTPDPRLEQVLRDSLRA